MNGRIVCYLLIYAAEAIIAHLYMAQLFVRKRTPFFLLLGSAFGYLCLFFTSLLNSVAVNAAAFWLVNCAVLRWGYRCRWKTALLHAAFLDFAMSFAEILVNLVISSFEIEFAAYAENLSVMIILTVLSKLLYLAFSVIGAKLFSMQAQITEEPRLVVLFCSLPLLSTLFSVIVVYFGTNSEMTDEAILMIATTVVGLFAINIIFIFIYNYLKSVSYEHLTLQLSLQKEKADTAYYDALREQADHQRILIHDIKNHLQTISRLAELRENEAVVEYVASLNKTLTPTVRARIIPNPVLNFILLRFCDSCRNNDVEFQYDIRETDLAFMDAPSITSLFENLLSNALEAAVQSQERCVELSIVRNTEQDTLTVCVVNSCDQEPELNADGLYATTKEKPHLHGVGLKSINRIVKKYNGISSLWYNAVEHRMYHVIQF